MGVNKGLTGLTFRRRSQRGIHTYCFTREPVNPLVFIDVFEHSTRDIYPCGSGPTREIGRQEKPAMT